MPANDMDWTYPDASGDAGIFEIGRRLAETLGRAPQATRFEYDPREMLRVTREIERASAGGRLLVGFQTAAKFQVETDRYRALSENGTDITVWAAGERPDADGVESIDYRALAPSTVKLANQWFLVTDRPERLAFMSYELGDPSKFGVGGAATPGKRFVGFVSDDPGVVDLLIQSLLPVGAPPPPTRPAEPSPEARRLADMSAATGDLPASGAGDGAVLAIVGRGADRQSFLTGLAIARSEQRDLVLVDSSAAGIMSPYSDWRGDDAGRPSPDRLFDARSARIEGREWLAVFLEAAKLADVGGGAWYPTHSGPDGILDGARRFSGALVVMPPGAERPGLVDRIIGMTPDRIRSTVDLPVIVAQSA